VQRKRPEPEVLNSKVSAWRVRKSGRKYWDCPMARAVFSFALLLKTQDLQDERCSVPGSALRQ